MSQDYTRVGVYSNWCYVDSYGDGTINDPIQPGLHEVKWPDGTVETVMIDVRQYRTPEYDMGHATTISHHEASITVEHNGAMVTIRLVKCGAIRIRKL